MKAMARQRSHSIEFKRQVAQEFIAGESLYALSKRHHGADGRPAQVADVTLTPRAAARLQFATI